MRGLVKAQTQVLTYDLSESEADTLDIVLGKLLATGCDPAGQQLHDILRHFVPEIPDGLGDFLADFRSTEPASAVLITGLPVDDQRVGPTPTHWRDAAADTGTRREELYLSLLSACLGETFGWPTLQEGRLVQNVLPIPGEEDQQNGHGSEALLAWHTEDGFHPYRCDYLGLFGIRNHDRVPTTLASVRDARISTAASEILREQRFTILPDDEHLRQLERTAPDSAALRRMQRMRDRPEPVAVLFGAPDDPYLRIDPYFMPQLSGGDDATAALTELVAALDRVQVDVVVEPGSLLFVDNYRAVHGRRAFASRYDGTDRWLKKTVSTRDLRKSREMRRAADARLLV
jgi:L-asparagine oxygenase